MNAILEDDTFDTYTLDSKSEGEIKNIGCIMIKNHNVFLETKLSTLKKEDENYLELENGNFFTQKGYIFTSSLTYKIDGVFSAYLKFVNKKYDILLMKNSSNIPKSIAIV